MNRKIMDGLSYGFYFIILCAVFLLIYLFVFKDDKPKTNKDNNDEEQNIIVNENIKLNSDKISLDIGASFDLKITLIPSNGNEIIKYESSDENIATISENGQIVGISEGTATIIVTVEGTDLKKECSVSVSNNIIIVNQLFVKSEDVKLNVGETYQLDVTVTPVNAVDKSLTFSSSKEDIATVSSEGVITALKDGNAKITIKSTSNPNVELVVRLSIKK